MDHLIHRYLDHQDDVLSFYENLMHQHEFESVKTLLQTLRDVEAAHKEEVMQAGQVTPFTMNHEFSHALALTPTHELGVLCKVLSNIISFREKSMMMHFKDIESQSVTEV